MSCSWLKASFFEFKSSVKVLAQNDGDHQISCHNMLNLKHWSPSPNIIKFNCDTLYINDRVFIATIARNGYDNNIDIWLKIIQGFSIEEGKVSYCLLGDWLANTLVFKNVIVESSC